MRLRDSVVGSCFVLVVSLSVSVPAASAGNGCGLLNEPCCTTSEACQTNLICNGSSCISCGGIEEPCCDSLTCDAGLNCEHPPDNCESLNGAGATCGEVQAAGGGATLGPEICLDCGDPDEECCPDATCNMGAICSYGTCEACGGSGEPCCEMEVCGAGLVCESCIFETLEGQGGGAVGNGCPHEQLEGQGSGGQSDPSVCQPCGGADQRCCDDQMCDNGFTCHMRYAETLDQGAGAGFIGGSCVPCGNLGEPCCDDSACNDQNLLCGAEFCEACGGIGEQCCANNTCPNAVALCIAGLCEELPAAPMMGHWAILGLLLSLVTIAALGLKVKAS